MMRIIPSNEGSAAAAGPASAAAAPVAAVEATGPVAPAASGAHTRQAPLQSAVLGPALAALQALPEIDAPRVAELRDALIQGRLPFDAAKLAGLIQRFHGGRG